MNWLSRWLSPSDDELPPEVDPAFYRRRYADVRALDDAEAIAHFRAHGAADGRQGSPLGNRSGLARLLARAPRILEIGPLAHPLVRGPQVRYFDVLPTDALREKARQNGLDPAQCPPVDYVSPTGDLGVVDARFDAVVSSHAIEHQPDLVEHLRQVARLLDDGGRYYLVVPDRRYCFDHYLPPSTIADVLDAWLRRLRVHSAANVLRQQVLTTHNDPRRHWRGDHGDVALYADPACLRQALGLVRYSGEEYLDAHAWQFEPESFRDLIAQLFGLGLTPLRPVRVYATVYGSNEFYAILEKTPAAETPPSDELPPDFDPALYLEANPDVAAAGVDARMHYATAGRHEGRRLRP